jgi:hypothetical protein
MDKILHALGGQAGLEKLASDKVDAAAHSAGFVPYGSSVGNAYALKNLATGMYLAAHKDGSLVCEDDTTSHHDLVWRVFQGHGKFRIQRPQARSHTSKLTFCVLRLCRSGGVALQSCHGEWLQAAAGPDARASNLGPQSTWVLGDNGNSVISLQNGGQFLAAVPPVEGQPAVFLRPGSSDAALQWHLEPIDAGKALLSRVTGMVM